MRTSKRILIIAAALAVCMAVTASLFYWGILHLNNPKYSVTGVDVSNYQGDIDWQKLSSQDIDFAYIKATEGSSFVDEHFAYNWEEASKCNLRVGAYHFFSFESQGQTQAESFCNTVTPVDNMLPPVIDVEFYGSFTSANDIDVDAIRNELRTMVDILTEEYGMTPIIYVSEDTYETIVNGHFDDCDLWYRSVYSSVPENVDWTLWQFSNRHHLDGYNGEERYIDMNAFNGTEEEFEAYPQEQ